MTPLTLKASATQPGCQAITSPATAEAAFDPTAAAGCIYQTEVAGPAILSLVSRDDGHDTNYLLHPMPADQVPTIAGHLATRDLCRLSRVDRTLYRLTSTQRGYNDAIQSFRARQNKYALSDVSYGDTNTAGKSPVSRLSRQWQNFRRQLPPQANSQPTVLPNLNSCPQFMRLARLVTTRIAKQLAEDFPVMATLGTEHERAHFRALLTDMMTCLRNYSAFDDPELFFELMRLSCLELPPDKAAEWLPYEKLGIDSLNRLILRLENASLK